MDGIYREVPGANENIVTFEPGIDYRPMIDAPFRVIFRPAAAIGLTKNAVDWGFGGSEAWRLHVAQGLIPVTAPAIRCGEAAAP